MYGNLPITGTATLMIGGASIQTPMLAAGAAAAVIAGLLILRLVKPNRVRTR